MMRRTGCLLMILLAATLSGLAMTAVPGQWDERLRALDPARPMDYFELGEEVADLAVTVEDRALARQLFGLAGVLDEATLGGSAALAIADLEEGKIARNRLLAAAELLAPTGTVELDRRRDTMFTVESRLAFAKALAALRRGDGSRAKRFLDKVDGDLGGVPALFNGGIDRLRRDCLVFKGGLRPDLSSEDLETHLVAEIIALSPSSPGWGVELRESGAAPLMVVDLERLDRLFGVDPARPYWRSGAWVGRRVALEGER